MTPAQRAKQAAAILERAEFGNAEPGEIERARRWLIEAAGMGWQDIASAPRDLVCLFWIDWHDDCVRINPPMAPDDVERRVIECRYGGWPSIYRATHWQPKLIPTAPE